MKLGVKKNTSQELCPEESRSAMFLLKNIVIGALMLYAGLFITALVTSSQGLYVVVVVVSFVSIMILFGAWATISDNASCDGKSCGYKHAWTAGKTAMFLALCTLACLTLLSFSFNSAKNLGSEMTQQEEHIKENLSKERAEYKSNYLSERGEDILDKLDGDSIIGAKTSNDHYIMTTDKKNVMVEVVNSDDGYTYYHSEGELTETDFPDYVPLEEAEEE